MLSGSCHLCKSGQKGDAVGAVHFTQPRLEPLLVLWVWEWTRAVMIMAAQAEKYNSTICEAALQSTLQKRMNRCSAIRYC